MLSERLGRTLEVDKHVWPYEYFLLNILKVDS